jgi:hypothetical protein
MHLLGSFLVIGLDLHFKAGIKSVLYPLGQPWVLKRSSGIRASGQCKDADHLVFGPAPEVLVPFGLVTADHQTGVIQPLHTFHIAVLNLQMSKSSSTGTSDRVQVIV